MFFNNKPILSDLIDEIDSLIMKIRLPETHTANKKLLEEDKKVLEPSLYNIEDKTDREGVMDFNKKENNKLVRALEEALGLPILLPTESEFHIHLPIGLNSQDKQDTYCKACAQEIKDKNN